MIEIEDNLPAGFKFFTGLCLVLGGVGLLGNSIFLILGVSHGLSPKVKELAPLFWLAALHLVRDTGYIWGGLKVKKRINVGRLMVLLCAAASLSELFYNTATSLSNGKIKLSPVSIVYFLIPLLLEGSILVYFMRKSVRAFVANPPQDPEGKSA